MDWVQEAFARRRQQMAALESSLPAFQPDVVTSADQSRGWLFLAEYYTCIPDAVYPWDPAVLRAIREFCPDAMPITIRSVWRRSRRNHMHPEEMVVVRHGIARAIRDLIAAPHNFTCAMPSTPCGARLVRPNFIEVNWYDKEVRPWGHDLPGAYLPFDWELHASLRQGYEDNLAPDDLVKKLCDPYYTRKALEKKSRDAEHAYQSRDLMAYEDKILANTSELELRDTFLGDQTPPRRPLQLAVPDPNPPLTDREIEEHVFKE